MNLTRNRNRSEVRFENPSFSQPLPTSSALEVQDHAPGDPDPYGTALDKLAEGVSGGYASSFCRPERLEAIRQQLAPLFVATGEVRRWASGMRIKRNIVASCYVSYHDGVGGTHDLIYYTNGVWVVEYYYRQGVRLGPLSSEKALLRLQHIKAEEVASWIDKIGSEVGRYAAEQGLPMPVFNLR